jgi:hypothetical protein
MKLVSRVRLVTAWIHRSRTDGVRCPVARYTTKLVPRTIAAAHNLIRRTRPSDPTVQAALKVTFDASGVGSLKRWSPPENLTMIFQTRN